MDLDERIDQLMAQLVNFREGVIDLPEVVNLDDEVEPERLLEVFGLIVNASLDVCPLEGELYYHTMPTVGRFFFHYKGVRHKVTNAEG